MLAIFDRHGKTAARLDDDVIVDRANRCRAFVHEERVISYRGTDLGQFADGFFWDNSGYAVAFIEGARGGPAAPITEITPIPPIPLIPPIVPIPPIPPIPPAHSASWSAMTFETFLSQ
jgi:hypothetical protein